MHSHPEEEEARHRCLRARLSWRGWACRRAMVHEPPPAAFQPSVRRRQLCRRLLRLPVGRGARCRWLRGLRRPAMCSIVRFGGIVALDGVSFDVAQGDICALIGPNGAGKTTLFNCMSRLYPYQAGDILFEGRSLTTTCRSTRSPGWAGPHLPEPGDVPHDDRARQRDGRRALPLVVRLLPPARCGCRRSRRGTRAARAGRRDHGLPEAQPYRSRPPPATCPSPSRSGSNWAARWPPSPSCCCSTSRPPA
jgi:hypothetical protein